MCIYVRVYMYIYIYICIEYHRKDIEEIGHDNSSDMENENERKADKVKEKKTLFLYYNMLYCVIF